MNISLKRLLSAATGAGLAVMLAASGAPARAQSSGPIVNVQAAPTPQPVLPPSGGSSCGLFQTCATTKIGLGKGNFIVRLSAIGVLPENLDSKIWLNGQHLPGHVGTTNGVSPELTFEYFLTDNISVDLIAASTRHEVSLNGTPLGKIDVASTWVLPPTVTFAWHFRPHKRFNPYVGIGATMAWFYNTQPAGGIVQKANFGFTGGPAVDIGFDYQLVGNWFFNVDAKQMFLRAHAWANDSGSGAYVRAHDSLDPTVVGMGIGYRF
ncbi:OmpW/AlkL family protein [Acidomonas methanolica]|uniref:OmpW/AlkL family protein n=1 Tax=Acidomonas methanolica TaxID=437 RepID=UPI00211A84FD|nr:OmpW family outer membrane protein [Acidomonas methanolica]MCQ9155802.1 OmpW family protein [Acidomonas methanolica]